MALAASALKTPLPLVPALAAASLVAVARAGFLFHRCARRADALATATASAERANAELARAEARARALEPALAAKKTALATARRTLPVEVRFRLGEPGTGVVAHFVNPSTAPLRLVEPSRPRRGDYGQVELTIDADDSAELAEKQGWAFRSGETLTVRSGDFRRVALAVP